MAKSVNQSGPAAQSPLTILRLSAENIMRISAVEIQSDGQPAVVIAGENEAGKSAVLAAIELALGGEKRFPKEPIRRGADKAKVVLDLGDIIVTRTLTASGSTLKVTNREGASYPSPQALLDGLVSKLTFDPLAFAEADDKAQAEMLRRLAGIDTTDLDLERKAVFEERTVVNREVTNAQGALSKAKRHDGVGIERVSAEDIAAQLLAADGLADTAARLDAAANAAVNGFTVATASFTTVQSKVERLKQDLAAAETELRIASDAVKAAGNKAIEARKKSDAAAKNVPDRTDLRQRMADVEATNSKVRDNQAFALLEQSVASKKAEADQLTARINSIDTEKAERLEAAEFPVEGLGLGDAGVTWNGLPFSQASTAIRIRASAAIGFAMNPRLKILRVKNGNDLGQVNLQLLADAAASVGGQVWVERISGGNGLYTVMIEDGTVVAAREAVSA
jgi:ribosomal silencing factor RsfS